MIDDKWLAERGWTYEEKKATPSGIALDYYLRHKDGQWFKFDRRGYAGSVTCGIGTYHTSRLHVGDDKKIIRPKSVNREEYIRLGVEFFTRQRIVNYIEAQMADAWSRAEAEADHARTVLEVFRRSFK